MVLLISFFIFAIPAAFGTTLFTVLKIFREKITLILTGTIFGLVLFITLAFILSPLFSLVFSIITPKLLFFENGELYTGIINAYGDLGWHVANITSFAQNQSIPPENPIFADTRLTYPFLTNFFSATLLTNNANIVQAVVWPALLLIPLLLTLLYCFTRNLTNYKSAAIIALLLFLLGGATLGWTRINDDWQAQNQSFITFITHLPDRDYSGVGTDQQGFHFLNPTFTLLLPQRPFLFGLPIALSILLLLLPTKQTQTTPTRFAVAGLFAGLLPLFHAHTVLALIPIIIALYVLNPKQPWFRFTIIAIIIGAPSIFYYLTGSNETGSFFRWAPGWMSYSINFSWYWIKNTGLLLPTILLGLYLPAPKQLKALAMAGLIIFAAANMFLFAPWAWDNFKLFVYWFIFSLPLVSWMIVTKFIKSTNILLRFSLILLVIIHLISGALDLWKITLPTATTWPVWSANAVQTAPDIQAATLPGQSILTAPIHNSVAVLAGRPIYLGYSAHIWSHGGNPWTREHAIRSFYSNTIDQLPESIPDYVLVGPVEKSMFPLLKIRSNWQLVLEKNEYSLYKIQ
jgi:hypothetical protein